MLIAGVDEAGRGPLAGPVTAAAVILGSEIHPHLNDSKRLSEKKREAVSAWVRAEAIAWGIGWASHEEIDKHNILRASHIAMRRALERLWISPERVIVDGSVVPVLQIRTVALVRADGFCPEVMAASVLAKTARDAWMTAYSGIEPVYDYSRHKGYPTPAHRRAVGTHGPSRIQRASFTSISSVDP